MAQPNLFETAKRNSGPVECLGQIFESGAARRAHFTELLRQKLHDPSFRKIEGFPIGSDENILALSDPPYYTACPNPFIADFIKLYGKPYNPSQPYSREPFAADVSEGKNEPIYNAHSYHTKVPHKAIMRYILHYTELGDIIFDGFCGTGMTGVAAQMCGDKAEVESLGYRVDKDGTISQQEIDENGKAVWKPFSKLGARRAVLNDLSPAATFIAYNYNTPVDVEAFEREAKRILKEVEDECGWMYDTLHPDGKTKGRINYTVWSDVFVCPECTREVNFWEASVDKEAGTVSDEFPCPYCGAMLTKRGMERAWVTKYDSAIKQTIRQAKQVPVFINYSVGAKRAEKAPDKGDLALIAKIEDSEIPFWFPTDRMMEGGETRRNDPSGITHVHHFYTKRNLWIIAAYFSAIKRADKLNERLGKYLKIWFTSSQSRLHKMNRYAAQHKRHVGPMANTLYISSTPTEISPFYFFGYKAKENSFSRTITHNSILSCGDAGNVLFSGANTVDYIFLDPPFGANINYSELSFFWESWLQVWTNNTREAIVNAVQKKELNDYRSLMVFCFKEAYRLLKPGRWMTIEFSNTQASVWNSIQTALVEAGFLVANIAALDKGRGGLHAIIGPTAVKQDLIISAYKPNGGFEERFINEAQTEEGVWDFVRTHLKYLPVVKRGASTHLIAVTERDPRILYDQMVAYFVRQGYPVPINSAEFQEGLAQRFSYRDGLYFLPEQAMEYDKRRLAAGGLEQEALFVSDESSAIAWLRQILKDKPQTFQDIHPQFMRELGGWQKHEKALELSELLEQNFLRFDGTGLVPEQIHAYLSSNWPELRKKAKDDLALRAKAKDRWYVPDPNKVGDLEKVRERALLREFEDYQDNKQRKLKVFRLEAVRAGFRKAWQNRDYATIIAVAQKIPESVLQEDPKLVMWYDQAVTRSGVAE